MQCFTHPSSGQVLIVLVVGIALGTWTPRFAQRLQPLGDGFLKLIEMLIAPIAFSVMMVGIYGASKLKKIECVGGGVIVYFEIVTTIALALDITLAYPFGPGHGMDMDPKSFDPAATASRVTIAKQVEPTGVAALFLKLIPDTFVNDFMRGDILQVLLVPTLFDRSLSLLGERTKPLVGLIDQLSYVLFRMMAVVTRLASLDVPGTVAFTVDKYDAGSLKQLGFLVLLFYAAVTVFVVVALGTILHMAGFNIFRLIQFLRAELLMALSTASSDAVLPPITNKLEEMGIKRSMTGLVIPTGYSFSLGVLSIHLTLTAILTTQTTNMPPALQDPLLILGMVLVTSKNTHDVPGPTIVILVATLSVIPAILTIGLVLMLSVDWFIGVTRALGNLIDGYVAAMVIAARGKDTDHVCANAILDGEIDIAEEGEVIPYGLGVAAPAAHTPPHT